MHLVPASSPFIFITALDVTAAAIFLVPQTSFAVGVLTCLLKLYGTDPHSKSCCGPVAPAVAPVAPGVDPWLYGSDPHSKSCCGPMAPVVAPLAPGVAPVAPGVAPWLYGSDPHTKSCCGPVAPAVAPVAPAVAPCPRLWHEVPLKLVVAAL